jgi:uncharacterized protein YchJ
MKVGRNDLCPCGSGRKFKKCHLAIPKSIFPPRPVTNMRQNLPPDLIKRANESFEKQRINEAERIEKFGKIRPIIYTPGFGDGNLVSVGGTIYKTPKRSTFTNFLFHHGLFRLGDDWREAENSLPLEEQHPLFVLHCRANHFTNQQPVRPEGYVTVVPNGPLSFCERFYYDLYTVDDNNALQEDLLHRLRSKEHFQGAMHELFVEATCLRAGFTILREPLQDPKPKNVEFIAIHKETQQHLSVEAKSRHRPGVMGRAGTPDPEPDVRFAGLINNAAAKDPNNPLAVLVDTNLPPDKVDSFYKPISLEPMVMSEKINRLATLIRGHQQFDPYNLLIFTNHPQHYGEDEQKAPKDQWAALISNSPRVKVFHEKALKDLLNALELYGNIPTDFPKLVPGTNIPE